jgi:hypothetical protein
MLSDISLVGVFTLLFCNYHVGRYVEINLKLIHMALGKIPRELGAM